jgi:hypothetical protein
MCSHPAEEVFMRWVLVSVALSKTSVFVQKHGLSVQFDLMAHTRTSQNYNEKFVFKLAFIRQSISSFPATLFVTHDIGGMGRTWVAVKWRAGEASGGRWGPGFSEVLNAETW